MRGLGTIVNIAAIALGGFFGLLFGKKVSEAVRNTVMQGLALCVILVGLGGVVTSAVTVNNGALETRHTMMTIAAMVIGGAFGQLVDIEAKLERLGQLVQDKLGGSGEKGFAQGFVTASLVYCVGAMAIVGSLNDGLSGDAGILFTKAILDGVSAVVFAAAMGYGVIFSAVSVGLYQGLITALAALLAPVLTPTVVEQMTLAGSLLIIGIGINLLGMAKIKVGNLLPALLIPPLWFVLSGFLPQF